jgi:hypothetical protein
MKQANIEFSPTKCGWVKRYGIWIKELKFLGMIYNGLTNE